jgi:hypothetical protein
VWCEASPGFPQAASKAHGSRRVRKLMAIFPILGRRHNKALHRLGVHNLAACFVFLMLQVIFLHPLTSPAYRVFILLPACQHIIIWSFHRCSAQSHPSLRSFLLSLGSDIFRDLANLGVACSQLLHPAKNSRKTVRPPYPPSLPSGVLMG